MKQQRAWILATAAVTTMLVLLPPPTVAQTPFEGWYSYSAKFVCGREERPGDAVVSGIYRTVINIHNPHYLTNEAGLPVPVIFFKKAVLALPQGNEPLRPTCKQMEELHADHALAVTCRNILDLFNLSQLPVGKPFEGFVVLELPPQSQQTAQLLDVQAVYTVSQKITDDGAQTIDVEEVLPRFILGTPSEDPCPGPIG